mgnify:CR=1 FL=1
MKEIDITKEKFQSYVDVQMSGVTNMFNVPLVCEISGLAREEVMDIMKNYSEYKKSFNNDDCYCGKKDELPHDSH